MKAENMQFNFPQEGGKAEVIIREVNKVNELEVKPPVKLNIEGTIGAVSEFLFHRRDQEDQINEKRCHILVDREKISIKLVFNEHDEYLRGTVTGSLSVHPKYEEFGINNGRVWTPTELGMFFKMNRSFFVDKAENMNLVKELMNFTATVNNSIERSAKESGDRTDKFAQTVNSNLPKAFTIKVPIFKGKPAETLEVETFAQVNGREVAFILLSPAANQVMEDIRDKEIDGQIQEIRAFCPNIAIIEQ
jgi:hypothetical protein